jgi:hypothetical protein
MFQKKEKLHGKNSCGEGGIFGKASYERKRVVG